MNNIYEKKAKKYKYKYLKLKREIEYIGELEGGLSINFKENLNEKINKEVDERLKKLSLEEKKKLLNEEKLKKGYFFDFFKIGIHNEAGIEQKINEEIKIRLQNLESERLENERLERLERKEKYTTLKNQLILLKEEIEKKIVPLYPNYILGNITNNIIYGLNIFIDDSKKTDININNPIGITQTDNVKNAVEKIANDDKKSIYLPPIIKCYFNINTVPGLILSKVNLSNLLIECLKTNNSDNTYDENQILQLFNNLKNSSYYQIYYIYREYIRKFEKNIDYYALTKVICDLYFNIKICLSFLYSKLNY